LVPWSNAALAPCSDWYTSIAAGERDNGNHGGDAADHAEVSEDYSDDGEDKHGSEPRGNRKAERVRVEQDD
jgi:hypothetical protein